VRHIPWANFTGISKASPHLGKGLHDCPVLISKLPILSLEAIDSVLEGLDVFRRRTRGSRLIKDLIQFSLVAISNSDVPSQGTIKASGVNRDRKDSIWKVCNLETAVGRSPEGEGLPGRYARYENPCIHHGRALNSRNGSEYGSSAPLLAEPLRRQHQSEGYSNNELNFPFPVHSYRCPPNDDL